MAKTVTPTGSRMAMAAPSPAPDAVPSTNGSANGLRSSPWNVAPARASPAPTTIAVRTRGRRSSQTMVSAAGVQVAPVSMPERPRQDDPDGLARGDPDRAQADPGEEQEDERDDRPDAQQPGRPVPPPAGTAGGGKVAGEGRGRHALDGSYGAGGRVTSGRMAAARLRRPTGSRGPGRVISVSWTGTIAPSLTAVMTFQPGRAVTCSGVGM